MERVTTQHKYLNFSLFLAGLLQHTREQIAFGFGRMGEAIETEVGTSSVQHTAAPRAGPTCTQLELQHEQFYQGRASWFPEPYHGRNQE